MNEIIAIEEERVIKKVKQKIKTEYKIVQYREAILEILEIEKHIKRVIIHENLPGQIELNELINKIKKMNEKIEIIFLTEKKENYEKLRKEDIKIINIKQQKKQIKKRGKIIHLFGVSSERKRDIIEKEVKKNKKSKKIIIIDFNNNKYNQENNVNIMTVKNKISYYLLKRLSYQYDYIYINNYDELNIKNINKFIKLSDKNIFVINTEFDLLEEQIKLLKEKSFLKSKIKLKLEKKSKIHPRIIRNIFYTNNRKEFIWK